MRWLGNLFDNYSLAFVSLLAPTTFLFLIALYIMGRTILRNRFWAFLFVMLNVGPNFIAFDTWGIQADPAPRTLMQALFPLLIALLWIWRDKPKYWPIVAVFTGALAYIHAVGTPTVMVIITLSFFVLAPKEWSFFRKIFTTIGLGLLILVAASGFILNYFDASGRTNANIDYDQTINLYRTFYPPDILNVESTTKKTLRNLNGLWLTQFAIAGTILLLIMRRKGRREVMLVLSWVVGIFLVSILIPFTERIVENYLRILPIETELIRGARFFIPTLGLLGLWALSELAQRIKIRYIPVIIAIIGIVFVSRILIKLEPEELSFKKTAYCISQGQFFCTLESDFTDVINVLRDDTPIGSTVFFSDTPQEVMPLSVRYYAHRSLVYSWKDKGVGHSDPAAMAEWSEMYYALEAHETTAHWYEQNTGEFLDFVRDLGADYLIVNVEVTEQEEKNFCMELVFQNETYSMLKLNDGCAQVSH